MLLLPYTQPTELMTIILRQLPELDREVRAPVLAAVERGGLDE